jgi:hypothetical protein
MNYLNLSRLKLLNIKNSISLLFCLFLFACSSTEQTNNNDYLDNSQTNGYYNSKFTHTQFATVNNNTIKKTLHSDHHLLMSLLNRPITADQAMMLAFAQERADYSYPFSNYGTEIKGEKESDSTNMRSTNPYYQLISQDTNAMKISAPN